MTNMRNSKHLAKNIAPNAAAKETFFSDTNFPANGQHSPRFTKAVEYLMLARIEEPVEQ